MIIQILANGTAVAVSLLLAHRSSLEGLFGPWKRPAGTYASGKVDGGRT